MNRGRAFTLIELLVVIAVIALLIGILLPSLASARRSGRDAACRSNLRQYGLAIEMYAHQYKEYMPAEGLSDGDASANPIGPWDDGSFWANAIPALLSTGDVPYYELQAGFLNGQDILPGKGARSVFVCPEALDAAPGQNAVEVDGQGHFMMWGLNPGATSLAAPRSSRPTYWCYVFNSGLDNIRSGQVDVFGTRHIKIAAFDLPSAVVLMPETMMTPTEAKPVYTGRMNKAKTKGNSPNSCRLAGRHNAGGNLLLADGHVRGLSREDATTDWSHDGLYTISGRVIWQPR